MNSPFSKEPYLNSDIKAFIEMLKKEKITPFYSLTPDKARQFLAELQKKTHKDIEAEIRDTNVFTYLAGNVDIRVVRPKNNYEKLPVILYVHGGGWVLGDKEVYDMLVRKIANCAEAVVIFINYTLSPEALYPLALNQIYATLEYIFENPDEFNIDSEKIAIVGDSAGGNMAAVTALKAKNENGPKILQQILLYPVTNADMNTKSYDEFKDGPWLTKKAMEWFWDAYVPDKKRREDPYISPLKAEIDDLRGLPPALIITDENDVLRDEGEEYARKLNKAGVETLNVRFNGTMHDFFMLNALADTKAAKGVFALICSVLKKALH